LGGLFIWNEKEISGLIQTNYIFLFDILFLRGYNIIVTGVDNELAKRIYEKK
jgi:hypothetical protein